MGELNESFDDPDKTIIIEKRKKREKEEGENKESLTLSRGKLV